MTAWIYRPAEDPLSGVRSWLATPALRQLVELSGGQWPEHEDLCQQLTELHRFSTVWDRREGGSRMDIAPIEKDTLDGQHILQLVAELGLVEPEQPTGGKYDWVLVLGGLATGCRSRTEYAGSFMSSGFLTAGEVCLLGSFRELNDKEKPDASEFAPHASNEVSMLQSLAGREFPSSAPWDIETDGDPHTDPRQAELRAQRDGTPPLRLYASRSSDPSRNANTADTYRQFARDVNLNSGRLLLVTTHIYAPYQHLDAVRILGLGHGVEIETIGTPPRLSRRAFDTAWYLQETRSVLSSALALVHARME